ncbi:integrator complex subunit 10-like, partial [Lingula anatina]|uniref:Integrator complex subunit 10 n=1 Tax=Lingula anatina TaxID=7574 RepID=A0A1S3IUP7_LINAN
MAASMEEDVTSLRPESWLIHRAKSCLKTDGCAAKAWLITARTLFPQNFDIKFEAYEVEKNARNIKLAAKDLQEMLSSFKEEPRLNQELQAVSDALQAEGADPKTALYKDIFSALPAETQRQMLLSVISQKQDVLHQCKATLLILRRFPDLVPDTGVNLAESLLSAEKHAHFHTALNCYRKYLVHDLLPIMLNCKEASLAHKQLYKWLQKSIEFYISYITQPPPLDAGLSSPDMMSPTKKLTMSFSGKRLQAIQGLAEKDSHIPRPWQTLFDIVTATGQQLGWEIGDFFVKTSREAQWQEILLLHNKCQQSDHSGLHRQLLYCTLILLLQCIHDYQTRMDSGLFTGSSNHQESIALMEGFKADGDEGRVHGPKHKKLKVESTIPQIHSNSNIPDSNVLMQNMLTAFKCWEMLHVDSLEK